MSYTDLYLTQSPLIISPDNKSEPIANIFGVPFDSTHSYKPGCRFGPDVIRDAFNNIEIFHPQLQVDLESANIKDYGNIQHTVVATEMLTMVEKVTTELRKENKILVTLGGEHLLTLGTYMSFPKETGYIVFDAHYDLREEYANTKLSHAAYLRRLVEKRGAENIIQVGARSFVREELEFLTKHKINSISDKEIRLGNAGRLLKDAVSRFDELYVSIDLDVVDPAFAPGVGNPEAVGITSRELYDMISSLENKKITGSDVVELNPSFDNGSTAALAAKMISTIIAMNVK